MYNYRMEIRIAYSKLYDYRKLVFALQKITDFWFQQKNFILTKKHIQGCIYDVIIPSNELLFNNLKLIQNIEHSTKNYLTTQKSDNLELYNIIDELKSAPSIITEWKNIEKKFIEYYTQFIDNKNRIKKIYIYPCQYGAMCSYQVIKDTAYILPRFDADVSSIVFGILGSGFAIKNGNIEGNAKSAYSWEQKQLFIDYLMTNTSLSDLVKKRGSIVKEALKFELDIDVIKKSDELYKKLGYPYNSPIKVIKQLKVDDKIITDFTELEKNILINFIQNQAEIITYDNLADIMWKNNEEKFSLEAITKTIQRIRSKIKINGVERQVIHTQKNEGYFYY